MHWPTESTMGPTRHHPCTDSIWISIWDSDDEAYPLMPSHVLHFMSQGSFLSEHFLSSPGEKANLCLFSQTLGRVPWPTASTAVKTWKRGHAVCVHLRASAWPPMEELVKVEYMELPPPLTSPFTPFLLFHPSQPTCWLDIESSWNDRFMSISMTTFIARMF